MNALRTVWQGFWYAARMAGYIVAAFVIGGFFFAVMLRLLESIK